jgi:hypothetical protein
MIGNRHLSSLRRPTSFLVGPRSMACLQDARGVLLRVTHGCVWVTQEHEPDDVFVGAGESLRIARDGLTIASWHGAPYSLVTLEPPARAVSIKGAAARLRRLLPIPQW